MKAGVGGQPEQPDCLGIVPLHPESALIQLAEIGLSIRLTLVGAQGIPTESFGIVLSHALTHFAHVAETDLGARQPCSAARRYQRTASMSSCGTPPPLA